MNIRKPNAVIYFIVYILVFPMMKLLFRLEVDRRGYSPPKGPFVVVSNHSSFMDFLVVMLSLYPLRFNAVTAQKFFLFKPLNTLLPLMGCIPKNLFDPDVRSVIGIKRVLKSGGRILLFPEGRCACDGVYAGMHKSTGKLIKKLGVPVVSTSIDGAYKCMPFWRSGIRFGRIRINISNLFTRECLEKLSVDEINDAIDARLNRDEYLPPKKPFRTFYTRRLAEGLENILYRCLRCEQEFTTKAKGNIISCAACGNAAEIDCYMNLIPTEGSEVPENIHEWYKEQALYEARRLSEDMEPVSVRVSVRLPSDFPGGGMDTCGDGIISLDSAGWHYTGKLRGEDVCLFFPIDTVPALPIDPNDVFQIYANGTFYMFSPEDARTCVKYSVIGECAYRRFASRIQMTPRKDSGFCG
jgi:1-acyl-sn-glycerol-3-phosphate acyltransferase